MAAWPRTTWLAMGALVGALVASGGVLSLPLPPALASLTALLLVAAALVLAFLERARAAAMLLGLGSVSLRAALPLLLEASATLATPLPLGSGVWDGEVVDLSSPSASEQRAFVRVEAALPQAGGWLLYAWLPRHPALVPGDRIAVRGTIAAAPADATGFAGFLESRGAAGTLKGHSLELVGSGGSFSASVEQLRWGIDEAMSRAIPEPEAGLASGILVGLRERVSRAVADDFMVTGLTHVVAISGWNIALVAGIVTALLRGAGLARRPRNLVVIAAIVAYTVLAGAEASVIRAAVMGGVVIVARESGRPSGAAAALGLACWGLLLAAPSMIADIGLQLSLAATAGLLVLGTRAEAVVRRASAGRAPRWFCETLGMSLAAQLSTLPLILFHFGRLSIISPLANLLVAPVVPMAMLGAAFGAVVGPLLGMVQGATLPLAPLTLASWLPLATMTRGASALADVPLASVELPAPFDLVGAGLASVVLVAVLRTALRRAADAVGPVPRTATADAPQARRRGLQRVGAAGASATVVAVVALVLVARPSPLLQVSVLDVGQGDAILLQASDGSRLLVDGGVDPDRLVERLDERIPAWDRRIDLVVLTHPHEDHAGGLAGLAPRYWVGRIAETGMASDGAGVREMRAAAERYRVRRVRLVQGDTLALGEARIDVLWPPLAAIPARSPTTGRGINDTSIVVAVTVGRQRALLTGDLEEDRDHDLLEVIPPDGRSWDLLKVAHHGSATASSRPLLESLRPRLAAISAGIGNRYGHPARATLERLAAVGSRIWRTDRQGTLSVALDGRPRSATALLSGPRPLPPCPAAGRALPSSPSRGAHGRPACYARPDGGSHALRSTLTAHVHLAIAAPAAAHDRGSRGGLVPGLSRHVRRGPRRPSPGRDSRAPPRHRQGASPRSPHAVPRTRQGRRRVAE